MSAHPPNTDQALLLAFARDGRLATPVDTNPVARELGAMLLAWDPAERRLAMGFTVSAAHLQGNGAVHGGVIATLLDFGVAFATLACLEPPRVAVTATLHLQFERGVLAPAPLRVEARVDRLGGRLAFASAQVARKDAPGEVIARATASLALVG